MTFRVFIDNFFVYFRNGFLNIAHILLFIIWRYHLCFLLLNPVRLLFFGNYIDLKFVLDIMEHLIGGFVALIVCQRFDPFILLHKLICLGTHKIRNGLALLRYLVLHLSLLLIVDFSYLLLPRVWVFLLEVFLVLQDSLINFLLHLLNNYFELFQLFGWYHLDVCKNLRFTHRCYFCYSFLPSFRAFFLRHVKILMF